MDFQKFDNGKRKWHTVPFDVIDEIVDVFQNGADKYGADNFKSCDDWNRYFDAMMRHIVKWRNGESHDKDSGKHHLSHVIVNAWILLWSEIGAKDVDKKA